MMCAGGGVRADCLEFALKAGVDHGITIRNAALRLISRRDKFSTWTGCAGHWGY